MSKGYKLVTDGTDNHLVLWDLRKEVRVCPAAACASHLRFATAFGTSSTSRRRSEMLCCGILLQGVTGSKMESVCDLAHITLNKNAVVGDVSAMTPGGVRIGAPAMSSRGLVSRSQMIFVTSTAGWRPALLTCAPLPSLQHPVAYRMAL